MSSSKRVPVLIAMAAGLTVISWALTLAGCGGAAAPRGKSPPSGEEVRVKIWELYKEYRENAADADTKYLGKRVVLTLVRGEIHKDAKGYVVRSLAAGQRVRVDADGRKMSDYAPAVLLRIDEADAPSFRGLRSDEDFSVTGVCEGTREDRDGIPPLVVLVTGCRRAD